ncbi:hypothetical protein ACFW2I_14075 [Streptomyces nigra]|uniref:hypothetical protein n=1 Tax=Streptomyces nigra TaxID=1827580 RepID=UPI0036C4FDDD
MFQAQAAHDGDAVLLGEIARRAEVPPDETRALLHDLTRVHRLVTELAGVDTPDMGPRWEAQAPAVTVPRPQSVQQRRRFHLDKDVRLEEGLHADE